MNDMTLGEKIVYLVHEYNNNPKILNDLYNAYYKDTDTVHVLTDLDIPDREYKESSISTGIIIGVGDLFNKDGNERWIWKSTGTDCWYYSPVPDDGDRRIKYQDAFNARSFDQHIFDLDDKSYSTEEGLFQSSTILTSTAYETVEAFLYIYKYCSIPFKINLGLFDIDIVIGLYKDANKRYSKI